MAEHFEKVLTDCWDNLYEENYEITSESFPGMEGPAWSINKYTLHGGKQEGVDLVEIDNGAMTLVVVPTRGMGVLEAFTDEVTLGWESPVRQVVHPAYVNLEARGGLGWLTGFSEFVCRCGLAYHGSAGTDMVTTATGEQVEVTLPLHGTIANTPAARVAVRVQLAPPYGLSVVGEVWDTCMYGEAFRLLSEISTVPGSTEFTLRDTVENLKAKPAEMELLYHCNFGPPLMGDGARVVAPAAFVCPADTHAATDVGNWDAYSAPGSGGTEMVYFLRLHGDDDGRTVAALVGPDGQGAGTMRFSLEQLPAFSLWKNPDEEADGYVTGLEPGTDYPNPRKFEREKGRVISLPPGGTHEAEITFGIVTGAEEVARVTDEIRALAEGKETVVSEAPDPDYCAG